MAISRSVSKSTPSTPLCSPDETFFQLKKPSLPIETLSEGERGGRSVSAQALWSELTLDAHRW